MSVDVENPFFAGMADPTAVTINPLSPSSPQAGGNPFFIGNEEAAPETRQMARLPYGLMPDSLGLPEYEARLLYDRLDDRDKIRTTAAFAGDRAARRESQNLFSQRKIAEYHKLEYPESDSGALAMQMGGPFSLEYIEEMQKTPEGKKQLKSIWTRTQLDNLTAKHAPEYLAFQAGAIEGEDAIALADWRRYVEDTLGGTARAGLNLGKDYAYTGIDYAATSPASAVRGFLANMAFSNEERNQLINANNHFTEQNILSRMQRENPDREISAEDIAGEFDPIPNVYGPFPETGGRKAVQALEKWNNWWDLAMYRPEAKTGSFAYDKLLSPVAKGLGQVTAAAAMAQINAPFAVFSMGGANKEEIRQRIIADGGDEEQAEVVSSLFAIGATAIEYSNIERLLKMTRSAAPLWEFLVNKVGLQALGEGVEEGSQSLLGGAGVEYVRSQTPGYQGFDALRFLTEFGPDAVHDAAYGALTGGAAAAGAGGPLNAAQRQVWYSKTQRVINKGVTNLSAIPEARQNPSVMNRAIDDVLEKSRTPKSLFIDAGRFVGFFGGDQVRMQRAMESLDITPQDLAYAQEAGAQVEVSTGGLIKHVNGVRQDAGIEKLARPDPEAPTLAILVAQQLAQEELVAELEKNRNENKALPSQFKIFRDQLIEAGRDPELAQQEADINYAMASVAGRRVGLSAEQFIDLHPIKVTLSNQVETARAVNTHINFAFDKMAAQDLTMRAQRAMQTLSPEEIGRRTNELAHLEPAAMVERGKESIIRALDGKTDAPGALYRNGYGLISFVYGASGDASNKFKKGYGLAHIFAKRRQEAIDKGTTPDQADAIARQVVERLPDVIVNGVESADFNPERRHVSKDGITAVLSRFQEGEQTGWVLTGWDADLHENALPGEPGGVSPGPDYAPDSSSIRTQMGAGRDTITIPASRGDVKWTAESLKTIVAESGVLPEQREQFTKFVEALLEENADVSDVGRLAREFETATTMAEGLEQAALGIQHLLAHPGGIGQAILDEMGIDAPSIQEGLSEMQQRVADLEDRAKAHRNFYASPIMRATITGTAENMRYAGQRGDVLFTPDINVIRVFSGQQNRSTVVHELFHIYGNHLVKAAQAENASEQVRQDFEMLNQAVGGGLLSTDSEVRRQADEQSTKMFEKYLSEGIAPSPGLAGAFWRFRVWMANVYRGVREFADIELSPEVRGVFDRMLAAEADVERARHYYRDVANLAPPSDISPEQARRLSEGVETAKRVAVEKQIARMVNDFIGGIDGRKRIAREVREDIALQRQYAAADALRNMGGMSREQVASIIGEADTVKLEASHKGIIKKDFKDKRDPSEYLPRVATENGYESVSDLVQAIVDLTADPMVVQRIVNLGGLDEAYIQNKYGREVVAGMRENYFGKRFGDKLFSRPNGALGALLEAERFGYESVEEMLGDIASVPNKRTAVKSLIQQRIDNEALFVRMAMQQDSATIADEAYHNDALSEAMSVKQAVLHQQAMEQAEREGRRIGRQLNNAALRRIAADAVAARPERKATQYSTAVSAFRKHAEAATKAEAKGDKITAAQEYQQMRLAHYEIREAMQARKDSEAFRSKNTNARRWLKRLEGSDRNKTPPVESGFRNAIKDVLTTWKVVTSELLTPEGEVGDVVAIPGPDANVDPEIAALSPSMAESIPPWILTRQGADKIKSWRDLTMEQVRELGDALNILTEQGRGEMRALNMPGIRTIRQAVDESIKRMSSRPDRPAQFGRGTENDSTKDKARSWLDRFMVGAIVPEYTMAMADGNTNITGGGVGPLQNMALALRRGIEKKNTLFVTDLQKIAPAMKTLRKFSRRFRDMDKSLFGPVPEWLRAAYGENLQWDAEMMIMVALNCGSATNLKAITQGYGMKGEQISSIFSVFTAAEMDAIQTIGDVIGSHFQEIDDTHFRLTNRRTEKVEPQKFTVVSSDGITKEMRGYYFPLVYDGIVDREVGGRQDYEVSLNRASFGAVRGSPRTKNGFTVARVGSARPPVLRLDTIYNHLDKVAHYIHLSEAVKEANAITSDKDWEGMFVRKFGDERYRSIRKYIKDIADPDSGNLGKNDVARRALEWIRHKGTTAALGFRIFSALKQRLDIFPAVVQMSMHSRNGSSGMKYALIGIKEIGFAGNLGIMNDRIKEIHEKSSFMRDTEGNITADMREMLAKARQGKEHFEIAGHEINKELFYNLVFMGMTSQDRAFRSAIWAGAYRMAKDGNADFDPASLKSDDAIEKASLDFADRMAATFSATTTADMTQWQRDKGLMRLYTTFLSGTVRRTSRLVQYLDAYRMGHMDAATAAKAFTMDAAVQAWVPAFMAMAIKAAFGDDDDEITTGGIIFDVFFDPLLSVIDGVPLFNTAAAFARYRRGGVFIPSGLGQVERRANSVASIPKNLLGGEYGKAAIKGIGIFGYFKELPVENLYRDGKKILEMFGVVDSDKGR